MQLGAGGSAATWVSERRLRRRPRRMKPPEREREGERKWLRERGGGVKWLRDREMVESS